MVGSPRPTLIPLVPLAYTPGVSMDDLSGGELWLPVPGFGASYEVSDLGRVRSLPRTVHSNRWGGPRPVPGGILTTKAGKTGYYLVGLSVGGKKTTLLVGRLVLTAFVGTCPDGMECRWRDRDLSNNSLSNLYWDTFRGKPPVQLGTCMIDDCAKPAKIRGWCGMHYERWRRYGDPLALKPRPIKLECSIEGCDRQARSRGWCARHYLNWRNYGNPVAQRDRSLDIRLREIGWTVTDTGCWEWSGARNEQGYGLFTASRLGFQGTRAHRVVYEHFTGALVRADQVLRHRCDNPPCVNPDHLLVGTQADNVSDMMVRGRHYLHNRQTCNNGHDLTQPGASKNYSNGARCVECHNVNTRNENARRQEYKNEWRRKRRASTSKSTTG